MIDLTTPTTLIGHTGLIGATLKDCIIFDNMYNSSNIDSFSDLPSHVNGVTFLACLSAVKWRANSLPVHDFLKMSEVLLTLSEKSYDTVVLYSTIDVVGIQSNLDESTHEINTTESYGFVRSVFESMVARLNCKRLIIIRLPALFGKFIKKNVLYDLINKNQIDKININTSFQWYNLDNLCKDTIEILHSQQKERVEVYNLFTEPIETSELVKLFPYPIDAYDTKSIPVRYNHTTTRTSTGYVETKEVIFDQIKQFVNENWNQSAWN